MPTFAHVIEAISQLGKVMETKQDADRLNTALADIQRKGGKILDIKSSMCYIPPVEGSSVGTCRIYLILYEAEKRL
jgi:hypothetical protein